MVLFLFTKAILDDHPKKVFNNGNMDRDFTYVDDIVEGVTRVIDPPRTRSIRCTSSRGACDEEPHPNSTDALYKVYNIGNSSFVPLMNYIAAIKTTLGKATKKEFLPMHPVDVPRAEADVTDLVENLGYKPDTPLQTRIEEFINWHKDYFRNF